MDKREEIPEWMWECFSTIEDRLPDGCNSGFIMDAVYEALSQARSQAYEAAIQACEAQKEGFLSPEYASNQPLGSICERFAIDECIRAIRQNSQKGGEK